MSMTRYDGDCGWEEENLSCFGKTRRKFPSRLQLSLECFEGRYIRNNLSLNFRGVDLRKYYVAKQNPLSL